MMKGKWVSDNIPLTSIEPVSRSQRVSEWLKSLEGEDKKNNSDLVFHLLKAINCNVDSLGYVIDYIEENEAKHYQLLGHLVECKTESKHSK